MAHVRNASDNVMADVSDVEKALVVLIGSILYPNGANASSLTGTQIKTYRGDANSSKLDPDLSLGISHVTVVSQPGFTRLTGGYIDPSTDTPGVTTITAVVSGATVTLGGTPGLGQAVGVTVAGVGYAYTLTAADTLTTAATALAALVSVTTDASASGAVVTFSTTIPIASTVGAYGTTKTFNRWQAQGIRVTTWAPTPDIRDAICSRLDQILSGTRWITLYDQQARFEFRNTFVDDCTQKENLWKRDLLYTASYATTVTTIAQTAVIALTTVNGTSTGETLVQEGADAVTFIDGNAFSLIGT